MIISHACLVPGPPTGLSSKTYNSTIIRLNWNPPDRPNGIILGYQLIYSGVRTKVDVHVYLFVMHNKNNKK